MMATKGTELSQSAIRLAKKKEDEKRRIAAAVVSTCQENKDKELQASKKAKISEGSISSGLPNEDADMGGPEEYELTPGAFGAASSDDRPEPAAEVPPGWALAFMNTITAAVSRMEVSNVTAAASVVSQLSGFGSRIDGIEERLSNQTLDVQTAINEQMSKAKSDLGDQFAELKKEMLGTTAAAAAARVPSASAPSAGPGRAAGPSGPGRSGPHRADENCIVIVREFPEALPRSVLKITFEELLLFVPLDDRCEVHPRISPIDKKIIMVFPSSAKADSFLETFRAKEFVYIDQETNEDYKLSAKKGRPLEVRRRGGATHPIYAEAAAIIKRKGHFRNAELIPNPVMKAGVMHTEFHALIGRKVTPLFSIVFREDQHETVVSAIQFAPGDIFTEGECAAIRASASLQ
jgi:hypothetical protein